MPVLRSSRGTRSTVSSLRRCVGAIVTGAGVGATGTAGTGAVGKTLLLECARGRDFPALLIPNRRWLQVVVCRRLTAPVKQNPARAGFFLIPDVSFRTVGSVHSARRSHVGKPGRAAPPRPPAAAPRPRRHWHGIRHRGRDGGLGRIRRRHWRWRQIPRRWLQAPLLQKGISCFLPLIRSAPRGPTKPKPYDSPS